MPKAAVRGVEAGAEPKRRRVELEAERKPNEQELGMSTTSQKRRKTNELDCHIRWMIRRDMPEVLEIEGDSFRYPWSEQDFIKYLRQRNCIARVAEHNDLIIGYIVYELYSDRFEILSLCVSRTYRRCLVGTKLTRKLTHRTDTSRPTTNAIVADRNLDAHLFFKSCGFEATEVLRGYYDSDGSDGYKMQRKRDDS